MSYGSLDTKDKNVGKPHVRIPAPVNVDVNTALGWGGGTFPSWSRYLQCPSTGTNAWTFDVEWGGAAPVGGLTIPISVEDHDGAVADSQVTVTSSLAVSQGDTSATVTVTANADTQWFYERWITITIGEDASIRNGRDRVCICLFPSAAPPELSLTAATPSVSAAGDTVTLNYTVNTANYRDDIDPTKIKFSVALAGKFSWYEGERISAGSTSGSLTLLYDGTGSTSDTCTVTLDYYQRTTSDYSQALFDPDTGTSSAYGGPTVTTYVDENQFRTSNGHNLDQTGRFGLYRDTKSGEPTKTPGYPSCLSSGSAVLSPNVGEFLAYHYQTVRRENRILEPWFNSEVRSTRNTRINLGEISNGSNQHYWRNEFDSQWGGGPEQFFKLKNYIMVGYCVSEWHSDESSARGCTFHRLGIRIRSKDRDHAVIFATDRVAANVGTAQAGKVEVGKTKFGETVDVFGPINGVQYWLWDVARDGATVRDDKSTMHPQSITRHDADGSTASGTPLASNGDYGVEDLSGHPLGNFGAFLWVKHRIDSSVSYESGSDQTGVAGQQDDEETAGFDDGNLIAYPWQRNGGDGSTDSTAPQTSRSTTAAIDDAGGDLVSRIETDKAGVLAHSPWVHVSNSDISVPQVPWPNRGAMFSPMGNCLKASGSGTVTITHS